MRKSKICALNVSVCACVLCVYVCAHIHMCMETTDHYRVFFLCSSSLYFLRQGLSVNLEPIDLARLVVATPRDLLVSASLALGLQATVARPRDSNSGPPYCTASPVPTEPSP